MTMYLVFSVFTSRPISLLAVTKSSDQTINQLQKYLILFTYMKGKIYKGPRWQQGYII
jgi:hypothetical protein